MSVYNNSASSGNKYIPYIGNWSINNATSLGFGNTVWAYLGSSTTSSIQLNWSAI